MNKLNKLLYFMKLINGNNNRYKRNKKKRNKRYTAVPQISRAPQRLGIGLTSARVTREISITGNSTASIELMSLITDSYEFKRQAEDYNFFRVKCINVIQHPINYSDVDGKVWIYMDWINSTDVDISTMGTWDNAKMLSYNAVRPVTYTFLPPNARLRYNKGDETLQDSDLPVNYTEWIPAKELISKNIPGWLKFMNVGAKSISVNAEVVLEFKGAKGYVTSLSKASKFIKTQNIDKIDEEDQKEQEIRKKEKRKELIEEFKEKIKEYD